MNNGRRRVLITGVGAVTPIGTAVDGLWAGLTARRSFRSDAIPQPHRGGDPRLSPPGPPGRETRQAARPLLAARGRERPARRRRRGARPGARGRGPRRRHDGLGAGRSSVRRSAGEGLPGSWAARPRPGARARRVPGRGQLQHRHRIRLHGAQLHQRHELRLRHDRRGRCVPRDPRRPGGRDARGRRRGAACAHDLRSVQRHSRDEHP